MDTVIIKEGSDLLGKFYASIGWKMNVGACLVEICEIYSAEKARLDFQLNTKGDSRSWNEIILHIMI